MGDVTSWGPDGLRPLVSGGAAIARAPAASAVELPPWPRSRGGTPVPTWYVQISWIHVGDGAEAIAGWRRSLTDPGVPISVRYRSSLHGGATWYHAETIYLNLLHDDEIGAVVIAHFDRGPA